MRSPSMVVGLTVRASICPVAARLRVRVHAYARVTISYPRNETADTDEPTRPMISAPLEKWVGNFICMGSCANRARVTPTSGDRAETMERSEAGPRGTEAP